MTYPRFKALHADCLPAGAYNTALVYDYQLGGVARDETERNEFGGRLAYFPTMAQAKRWAAHRNTRS